jgi:uncharacterized damage-inducible protein DinB
MISYLDELFAHQEWADAEDWRAIEAHPAALADKAIRERLLHIHLVQHGFLWVTSPQRPEVAFKKLENFPSISALKGMRARRTAEGGCSQIIFYPDYSETLCSSLWARRTRSTE